MPNIPSFPQALLDKHHHWHDPLAHPGTPGGRQHPFGTQGAGIEFLQFHRDYIAEFHAWYDTQPFADQNAVAPWSAVPPELKNSAVGWNGTRAAQESRIINDVPPFSDLDELGAYIEGGIHGYLHNASANVFNEPIIADLHSPTSTVFYKIHGLVDYWSKQWTRRRKHIAKELAKLEKVEVKELKIEFKEQKLELKELSGKEHPKIEKLEHKEQIKDFKEAGKDVEPESKNLVAERIDPAKAAGLENPLLIDPRTIDRLHERISALEQQSRGAQGRAFVPKTKRPAVGRAVARKRRKP